MNNLAWVPRLGPQWPQITAAKCLKYNEWMIQYMLWSVSRPAYFLVHVMPTIQDGRVNDFTSEQRTEAYEGRLSPDGKRHEEALKTGPSRRSPWGIITCRDGLDWDTEEKLREIVMRKIEYNSHGDRLSQWAAYYTKNYAHNDLITLSDELKLIRGATRDAQIIERLSASHTHTLRDVHAQLAHDLTTAVKIVASQAIPGFTPTVELIWAALPNST